METNKCPLCKQSVSQELFEKITGVWRARRDQEQALRAKQKELLLQQKKAIAELAKEKQRLRVEQKDLIEKKLAERTKKFALDMARLEAQKKAIAEKAESRIALAVKAAERRAKAEMAIAMKEQLKVSVQKEVAKANQKQTKELFRAQNTLNSTRKQMTTLQQQGLKQQEKILNLEKQLKDQTTPQIEGLLFEDQLLGVLKKDFPEDHFTHTGKGGDILQEIKLQKEVCGLLVYECKKVTHWSSKHVEQAYEAKVKRQADFAILVTNAPKKGSGGFFVEKGVIVVSPGGVLAIAAILREQVIKIARLKLTKSEKQEAVEQTMKYLQGAEFKNSLEVVIKKTIEMYDDLKDECKDHIKIWKKRHDALKSVYLHTARVQHKTTNLIAGRSVSEAEASLSPFPVLPNLGEI